MLIALLFFCCCTLILANMNASLAHGSAVSDVPLVPGEQPPADSIRPASGSVSGTCPDYPPIAKDLIDALKQIPQRRHDGFYVEADIVTWRNKIEMEIVRS